MSWSSIYATPIIPPGAKKAASSSDKFRHLNSDDVQPVHMQDCNFPETLIRSEHLASPEGNHRPRASRADAALSAFHAHAAVSRSFQTVAHMHRPIKEWLDGRPPRSSAD
jgi:hypothetical protein